MSAIHQNCAEDHLSPDQIESYALNRCTPEELDLAEDHLLLCESCRQAVEQEDMTIAYLKLELAEMAEKAAAEKTWKNLLHRKWTSFLGAVQWQQTLVPAAGLAAAAILYFNSPPSADYQHLQLVAQRGVEQQQRNVPEKPLRLELDLSLLPSQSNLWVEIVADGSNAVLFRRVLQWSKPVVQIPQGLPPGDYWVRAYPTSATDTPLREYALHIGK
jgi:hypothetical protein